MPDLEQQYIDPYEKQIQEQYSGDPRQKKGSLGRGVFNFLKGAAIFTATLKGISEAKKLTSYVGARLLKKLPTIAGKNITQIFRNITHTKANVTNTLLSDHFSSISVYNKWKAHWDKQRLLVKTNRVGSYFNAYKNLDKTTNIYSRYYKTKLVDFTKPDNFFSRVTGKTLVTTSKYVGRATDLYFANKVLNIVGSSEPGGSKPAWYNLPAHVGDYLRFTAQTIPMLATFSMLGPIVGISREHAADVVSKGVELTGAKTWLPGLLHKLAAKIPKIQGSAKGVGGYYNALKSTSVSNVVRDPVHAMKYAQQTFRKSMSNYLDNVDIPQTSQLQYALLQLNRGNPSKGAFGGGPGLRRSEYGRFLTKWIKGYRKRPIPSWFERATQLRRPVLSSKELDFLLQGFRIQDKSKVKPVLESLQRKGVPLYDKGVYKGGKGTSDLIDLRNLDPTRIRNNFVQWMNQHLKIPFTKIDLFPIFHVDRVLKNKPIVKYLYPNEKHPIGIGPFNPTGEHQVGPMGGFFMSGQFWELIKDTQDPTGATRSVRITPSAVKLKLASTGKHSVEREVMKNYVDLSMIGTEDNRSLARKLGPLGNIIYKTLDLTKVFSRGSIFGKMKGILDKYIRPDSPLNILGLADDALYKHRGNSALESYRDSIRVILSRASSHASDIFRRNPRVLENMGVDPTMSDPQIRGLVEKAGSTLSKTQHGTRLMRWYRVNELMNKVEGDMDYREWHTQFKRAASGANITGKQELLEFLAADKLVKNRNLMGVTDAINDHVSKLSISKSITESEASTLKIWAQRFAIENAIVESGPNMTSELVTRIDSMVKSNWKDYNTVIKKCFSPMTQFIRLDESKELHDLQRRLIGNTSDSFSGFVALPKSGTSVEFPSPSSEFVRTIVDKNDTISVGSGNIISAMLSRRLERLFDIAGLGLDLTKYKTGSSLLFKGILGKRALPIAGGIYAATVADQLVDIAPMFDGTLFDEGLGVAVADQGVKARMMLASTYDFLGVTSAAKYAEGLMPGFIDSPLMRAMRGAVAPIMLGTAMGGHMNHFSGPGIGMLAGVGLGVLQGFGAFDLTKSREELEDVYSGREEIPVRSGRGWIMSSGNFQGGRVQYFRPNWYARMKSKYNSSPDGLGSPVEQLLHKPLPFLGFNPIGHIFDPHHYAYRHYYSQPYPETGVPFEEVPIVGPTMAATVGRLISPHQTMHAEELKTSLGLNGYTPYIRNVPGGGLAAGDNSPFRSGTIRTKMKFPVSSTDITQAFDRQLYNVTEAAGLWGFGAETMVEKMFGFKQPFEGQAIMANASEMTSFRRAYWDLNLGDPIGATELWRRFLPRPRQHLNQFNPLINAMPCLIEGSEIQIDFGKIDKVENVKEGDVILTHKGRLRNVLKSVVNDYDDEVYSISTYNNSGEELWVTKEHPFFVERNNNRDWIKSKDLSIGDYILFPICQDDSLEDINISDFVKDIYYDKDIDYIYCGKINHSKLLKNNIKLDYDFGRLCGFYLAEGHLEKTAICMTFNITEDDYINEIIKIKDSIFPNLKYSVVKRETSQRVYIYSKMLSELFYSLFDKVKNKRILSILINSKKEFLEGLLYAYIQGDGYYCRESRNRSYIRTLSVSSELTIAIRNILSKLGVLSSFTKEKVDINHIKKLSPNATCQEIAYSCVIRGKDSEIIGEKLFGINPIEKRDILRNKIDKEYIYFKIRKIDKKHYKGRIYNFEIEEDNSYCSYSYSLHNSWMPDSFHIGNPYAQVPEGELLLPGSGFEAAHDVTMSFPAHAEMLGLELDDTVRAMLGLHPHNYSKYAHSGSDVDRKNREILASSTIYDPYHNISGMHDGTVRIGRTKGVQKIKNLSEKELDSFIGPPNSDISEINFYMRRLGLPVGSLSYQFNGQPILTHSVKYSEARYLRDIDAIRQARIYAKELLDKGLGFGSEAYSHIDRLNILANVAPYSDEYKTEENIVKLQMKAGYPHLDRLSNIKRKRNAIMRKQEYYPYRFTGKVLTPDAEYNNQSLNEDIKIADQYTLSERFMGSIWEKISHMHTPINSKFMNYRTPREAYERNILYGRDMKMWSHPIDHYANAYARGFMSKTTPFAGSMAGAWAGHVIGGPGLGTAIGAGVGAVYGGLHGVYRSITGTTYIPGVIEEQRKMGKYFDHVSYAKNMLLYNATGDRNFLEEAKGTMAGLIPGDTSGNNWSHMYRATPPQEKPYIMSFIQETDPQERSKILDLVPEDVGEILKNKWSKTEGAIYNNELSKGITNPLPTPDWAGWSAAVPLEDVQVKVIEQEGMSAHDFGLGWYDQMQRINESPWLSNIAVDMKNTTKITTTTYNQNISEMRRTIEMTLNRLGVRANVVVTPGAQNNITIVNL